jgi:hypothetical protein
MEQECHDIRVTSPASNLQGSLIPSVWKVHWNSRNVHEVLDNLETTTMHCVVQHGVAIWIEKHFGALSETLRGLGAEGQEGLNSLSIA